MKKNKKINLVVFDFDGTVSAHDSNYRFGKYCFKHSIRPWIFSPVILFCIFASFVNRRGIWWRELMRSFLTPKMVKKLSPGFIKEHKSERFGWVAERVAAEKKLGNVVILISAGPDYLVPKLVKDLKFDDVITSKLESKRPWKFKFFCWGKNKVLALDVWAAKNNYDYKFIRSYSDSRTDYPIMNAAMEPVWIHPKTGVRLTEPK